MNQKIILSGAVAIVILAFAFAYFQITTLQRENRALMEKIARGGGRSSEKNVDPYLSGPVKNRILKGADDIKKCYQQHTATQAQVREGNIMVDWQIDTDGEVLSPEIVSSPFQAPAFEKCITSSIAAWKFPEPALQTYVSHTFRFTDAKGQAGK